MKSKIIAILMILLLILSCVSFATEDVSTTGTEDESVTEERDEEETNFQIIYDDFGDNADLKEFEAKGDIKDDLFKIEESVTVDQNVSGNVYLMANTVIIKGVEIEGNVFICGKDVIIDGTEITGSVYAAGENITIKNETDVYNDAYLIAESINLEKGSWIERNAKIGGQNIVIDGFIDNNVYISAENIQIGENTKIGGKLEYESKQQAKIPAKSSIGSIKFNKIEEKTQEVASRFSNMAKFMRLISFIIRVILVYVFVELIKKNSEVSAEKNILKSFGYGCLFMFLVPIISILLITTIIGLGLGLIILLPYIFAIYIASAVATVSLAKYIFGEKINSKLGIFGATIAFAVGIWLVSQLGVLGVIVRIFTFFFGLGEIIIYIFKKHKKNNNPEVIQAEKVEVTENSENTEKNEK